MQRPLELSPVSDRERFFDSSRFVALWASFSLGFPALLLGVRLGTEGAGGFGLSFGQLAFIIPLGVVTGAVLLGAVAVIGSDVGVPGVLMLQPSFGVAGSWLMAVLVSALYLAWAAFEIQLGARLLGRLLNEFDVPLDDLVTTAIVAVVVGALLFAGLARVAGIWIRRFAIWAALAVLAGILWKVSDITGGAALSERVPVQGKFWLGVDAVVLLMMVWLPLAADTARFTKDTTIALGGAGFGFGVGTGALLLSGSFVGIVTSVAPTDDGLTAVLLEGAGFLTLLAAGLWLLAGETDQPFGFVYGASTSLGGLFLRRAPVFLMIMVLGGAGAGAYLLDESTLFDVGRLFAGIIAVMFSVVLADFYIVRRRRYLADGLYQRRGFYRGVNLLGLVAFVLGVAVQQWIDPIGPPAVVDVVRDLLPGAGAWADDNGVPATMMGMTVAFVLYAGVGRILIKEWESVSTLRI